MKVIKLVIALIALAATVSAQTIDLNEKLPRSDRITKGVLPNGLTYYIYPTDVTKNVASYYIIQNVGSVLENDGQEGLAHFLEHMAFNGTQHFKGKGILNTLQKHGALFGKDINAYTSFDETVYNINHIPTNKPGLVDTCLLILKDWSNYLLLTDEEIDAERGVIKEEWRTRQSGQMRLLEKSLPAIYNNSRYAERMPIGLMSVVDNFEYKVLRDFYHDWYRTDLQAIAVIGDVDVNDIEQRITKMFSSIPAVENPRERYITDIPDNEKMLYHLGMDEEISTAFITFLIKSDANRKGRTVEDLRTGLLTSMVSNMLSARLNEVAQNPDAPFLNSSVSSGGLGRTKRAFSVRISPKKGMQQTAFETVMRELNRAVKFGFTEGEINRAVAERENTYTTYIAKEDDLSHTSIAQRIQNDYLSNRQYANVAKEFEIVKPLLASFTPEDLHKHLQKLYSKNNRVLNVTGVAGENNLSETEALNIIKSIENDETLTAYKDEFGDRDLLEGTNLKAGKIVSEKANDELGSITFTLNNGAKVHYKFADKNKNDVKLVGISYGGLSLLKDEDLPSAGASINLAQLSGLGNFSASDLPKVLAGKSANVSTSLSALGESISGSSTTKDVETMLQMVYLTFENPRMTEDAFQVLKNQLNNSLARKKKNVGQKIQDSITTSLYGKNNPRKRLFDESYVKDVSFEKAKEIYSNRFSNAADFEFFIVGDVPRETVAPLIAKYIGGLRANEGREEWKDKNVPWVKKNIDKDVYIPMEDPKSSVRIAYKRKYKHSLKNVLIANTLGDVLKLRYTETLREDEGGTYGARVQVNLSQRPKEELFLHVGFDCNPEKAEHLSRIVYREINKLKRGEVNQEDLDKTLSNYLKSREDWKNYNSYDMSLLQNYFLEDYNMNDPATYENIVNSITAKDIKKMVKKLLKKPGSYEIIIKPEK